MEEGYIPHNYDLGVKGLPLTNTDRDVEGNPPLEITDNTHTCSMQVSFQKYTYPAQLLNQARGYSATNNCPFSL